MLIRLIPRSGFVILAACVAVFLAGCTSPSRPAKSAETLAAERTAYLERTDAEWGQMVEALVIRAHKEVEDYNSGRTKVPPSIDLLVISGGGDWGAFGAGFLKGWGSVTGDLARPRFDAISGVSTGALIAPFAFIGDEESYDSVLDLYQHPKKDWTSERGLVDFLFSGRSYMVIPGLERDIRASVNMDRVRKMAAAAREGRACILGATNLDYGCRSLFLISKQAIEAESTDDPSRVQDAMLASSAIPVAFPPREIEGNLYVDGGLTSNIFFSRGPNDPYSMTAVWKRKFPQAPLPPMRFWVIINNQASGIPQVTQPTWSGMAGVSISTAIRVSTLLSLQLLHAQTIYGRDEGWDVQMRWIAIPDEWRAPVEGLFTEETMRDLGALGLKLGADPNSWHTDTPKF